MSCVVGVVERGGVCMGTDGLLLMGDVVDVCSPATGKLIRRGDMLVGMIGTAVVSQVVRQMEFPEREGREPLAYLDCHVVPALTRALWDVGIRRRKPEQPLFEGGFLVAMDARLFVIGGDLYVHEPARPFAAIGSGGPIALGALFHAEEEGRLGSEARVYAALRAASAFVPGVGEPYSVEWTGRPLHAVA